MLFWFLCVSAFCVHSCVKCVRKIAEALKVPVTQVTWQNSLPRSEIKSNSYAIHILQLAGNSAQAKSACFHSLNCTAHWRHSLRNLPVSVCFKEKALRALLLIKRRRRRRCQQRQQQSKTSAKDATQVKLKKNYAQHLKHYKIYATTITTTTTKHKSRKNNLLFYALSLSRSQGDVFVFASAQLVCPHSFPSLSLCLSLYRLLFLCFSCLAKCLTPFLCARHDDDKFSTCNLTLSWDFPNSLPSLPSRQPHV